MWILIREGCMHISSTSIHLHVGWQQHKCIDVPIFLHPFPPVGWSKITPPRMSRLLGAIETKFQWIFGVALFKGTSARSDGWNRKLETPAGDSRTGSTIYGLQDTTDMKILTASPTVSGSNIATELNPTVTKQIGCVKCKMGNDKQDKISASLHNEAQKWVS